MLSAPPLSCSSFVGHASLDRSASPELGCLMDHRDLLVSRLSRSVTVDRPSVHQNCLGRMSPRPLTWPGPKG